MFWLKTPKSILELKIGVTNSIHFFRVKITTIFNHGLNRLVMLPIKTLKSNIKLKSGAN
jgi:hypothetical protein